MTGLVNLKSFLTLKPFNGRIFIVQISFSQQIFTGSSLRIQNLKKKITIYFNGPDIKIMEINNK